MAQMGAQPVAQSSRPASRRSSLPAQLMHLVAKIKVESAIMTRRDGISPSSEAEITEEATIGMEAALAPVPGLRAPEAAVEMEAALAVTAAIERGAQI